MIPDERYACASEENSHQGESSPCSCSPAPCQPVAAGMRGTHAYGNPSPHSHPYSHKNRYQHTHANAYKDAHANPYSRTPQELPCR
jgi:hypothetical protein